MPAKYSIKRNSLSSKWGVWAAGTEASSTVEKLIAEVRTNEEAEAYCTRIDAGEAHEAIIASFSAKKPRKDGSGLFGRFRKSASKGADVPALNGAVSNSVIEIETAEKKDEAAQLAAAEAELEQAAAEVVEVPSRFQVIEQPKPEPRLVPEPAPEPEPVVDVETEPALVPKPEPVAVPEPAPVAKVEPKPEPVAIPEPAPVAKVEPKPEPITAPEPAPVAKVEPMPKPVAVPEPEIAQSSDSEGERLKMVASPSSLSGRLKAAFGRGKSSEAKKTDEIETSASSESPVSVEKEPSVPVAPAKASTPVPSNAGSSEAVIDVKDIAKEPVSKAETKPAETPVVEMPQPTTSKQEVVPAKEQPAPKLQKPASVQKIETAPVLESDNSSGNGALVDWTFTPPPDITPEELKASGQEMPESVQPSSANEISEKAEPVGAEAPVKAEAPKLEQPTAPAMPMVSTAPKPVTRPVSRVDAELTEPTQFTPSAPASPKPDASSITVEIGISKALKDVTIGDPRVPDKKYNKVASQEYTEVSKAFAAGNSPEALHEELIHLAAVCLAWADAIEKRKLEKNSKKAA